MFSQIMNEEEFLSLVGSAEKQSEHPLAQAIVQGIKEKVIALRDVTEFEAIPGFGIKAMLMEKKLLSEQEIDEKV